MISKSAAELALAAALETGGDFAEIFIEDTRRNRLVLMDGHLDSVTSDRSHGAGVRVFKGTSAYYATTNDTTPEGLIRAARQAAAALRIPQSTEMSSRTPDWCSRSTAGACSP